MRIIDGIACADTEKTEIRAKAAKALDNFQLWVKFTNDEVRVLDFTTRLQDACYQRLQEEKYFRTVFVEHGVPTWGEGEVDISPAAVWYDGITVGTDTQELNAAAN